MTYGSSIYLFYLFPDFRQLNSYSSGSECEQDVVLLEFPLLEKVDCVRSDEASENCWITVVTAMLLLDEILISLYPIYRDRTFLMMSFVGLSDNLIGYTKTIETENKRKIESENVNIYDIKKGSN